jgi:hypothetical protein
MKIITDQLQRDMMPDTSSGKEMTAMQELISRIQVAYERGDKKYKPAFEYWLNEAKNLLPKEREQHFKTFVEGECHQINKETVKEDFDFYFTQTFKQ